MNRRHSNHEAESRLRQRTSTPKVASVRGASNVNLEQSAASLPPLSPPAGSPGFDYPSLNSQSLRQSSSRLYKLIVVGEVAAGKSALITRFVHNHFSPKSSYRATIGVDFQLALLKFNEELEIRLQLWDIAGQERFSSMTRAYYKGAQGALVVFDHTDARTFTAAIDRWKKDLDSKVRLPGGKPVPCILVCNKVDLERDPRLPDDFEISRLVQERGFIPRWIKTSAKTGTGVSEVMNLMIRYIMAVDIWNPPLADPDPEFDLGSPPPLEHCPRNKGDKRVYVDRSGLSSSSGDHGALEATELSSSSDVIRLPDRNNLPPPNKPKCAC